MTTQVKLKTSMGDIVIELNEEKAPKTVENFLKYVDSEFYTGTIFHRIINGFMVQGGGMDANMKELRTKRTMASKMRRTPLRWLVLAILIRLLHNSS